MKSKIIPGLIITVLVLLTLTGGSCTSSNPSSIESTTTQIAFNPINQEESRQIAEDFIKNCPTFKFDGIEDSLNMVKVDTLSAPTGSWDFTIEFECRHAGYGDRTGQLLADVITPHQAIIKVERTEIKEAIMDQKWNMLNQKMLEISNSSSTQIHFPIINDNVSWQIGETVVSATITRPDDQAVHPAGVFVAGSGPTDRDWNSPLLPGTNGSARLLAEELARSGFVTIRYDKRFSGPNAQKNLPLMMGKISMEGHVEELAGAVDLLKARPEVDPKKIFVFGNSEGTIHALNYQQSRQPQFAGLILSAMPGRNLAEVTRSQLSAQIASLPDAEEIMAGYDKLMGKCLAGEPFTADPTLPQWMNDFVQGFYAPINLPFTTEFLSLDPAPLLAKVTAPALVITGKKDIQVDFQLDGTLLESAAGGHENVSFVYPENANHVLKYESRPREILTGADGLSYNSPDQTLDPDSVQIIKNWLILNLNSGS